MAEAPEITRTPRYEIWGIGFAVVGILVTTIALIVQYFIIDHGSSGQITAEALVKQNIWGVLTGLVLFAIGYIMWLQVSTSQHKFTYLFLLAFSAFFISNFAVFFSLSQVQVVKT